MCVKPWRCLFPIPHNVETLGHHVHWIQARRYVASEGEPCQLLAVDGHLARLIGPDGEDLTWWFHDTTVLDAPLLLKGQATVQFRGFSLLTVGRSLLYSCRDR